MGWCKPLKDVALVETQLFYLFDRGFIWDTKTMGEVDQRQSIS